MKNFKRVSNLLCLLTLSFFSLRVYSQVIDKDGITSPKLFQVTTAETRPGDAVLVRGEYLDKVTGIQVCRLTDGNVDKMLPGYVPLPRADETFDYAGTNKKVKAEVNSTMVGVARLLQGTQSLKFIVPPFWKEGVYSLKLTAANNKTLNFYINVPIINWVISEDGPNAIAGSYLRIQGKNLLRKGVIGQAVLISKNDKNILRVKVIKAFDDFSVSINIPENTPANDYYLYYHNGQGGKTAWSQPLRVTIAQKSKALWSNHIFNVKDFGAKGNGTNDETSAFKSAINKVNEMGGGTVFIPRGRYLLTDELVLPPFTLLKGESKQLTQLFWNSQNWASGKMPNSLLSGTHDFAITDLNIWASRAWGIIKTNGPLNPQGTVMLENLIIRQSAEVSSTVYQSKGARDTIETEIDSKWRQSGIILNSSNIKVRNCDFNCGGMYMFYAVSGFIQKCKFTRNHTGINQSHMVIHPKGLIFEDCYKEDDGYGYGSTIDESYDLYEARNTMPFNYINDREAMTLDGGGGAYNGKIRSIDRTTIVLPRKATTFQWVPNRWVGGGVFIIEGRGAGQYRRIKSHSIDTIVLDQPFLVDPDSNSVISITTIRKNLFFVDNQVSDAGAYQFYGSAQNGVISGLKILRSAGIIGRGSLLYHGKQPNWYIDIVNCELREGNYCHWFGVDDRNHSGHQNINILGTAGAGLNIGTLIRRNKLFDFSYIQTTPGANPGAIADLIIEDNSITTAETAILIGGMGDENLNTLIHNNHYSDVKKHVAITKGIKSTSYLIIDDGVSVVSK